MSMLEIKVVPKTAGVQSVMVVCFYGVDDPGRIALAADMVEERKISLPWGGLTAVEILLVAIPPALAEIELDGPGTTFDAKVPVRFKGDTHFRIRLSREVGP